jgi:hypothetical protein
MVVRLVFLAQPEIGRTAGHLFEWASVCRSLPTMPFPSPQIALRDGLECQQPTHPQQVVRGDPVSGLLRPRDAAEATGRQPADGLPPPEDLLDAFAEPLAELVSPMASGTPIQARRPAAAHLGHMGMNSTSAQRADKVPAVRALIRAQRLGPDTPPRLAPQQVQRGVAFRGAGGRRHRHIDAQPMPILHEHMTGEDQPRLFAGSLAQQARLRIGRAPVRGIGAALPVEVYTGIPRIVVRRRGA